ncbi:low temperature requirement protein A [Leifsonia sp. H3M29-4]|uniref:low temperature requirement protein A n=1 Tax=Salinibacterium metalliresistens TaxID=3031321 RepID=UPI0023D9DEB3|nr:low temperature requirement protein A [Salinibacterium metalliresistens]MDF1478027.1 low temperature requirement protein A [Salinibacterium metalliresistens]
MSCHRFVPHARFASAFDTDDWFYRITTLVQMIGVIVLALGLPAMFHSLDVGTLFDNDIMVIGYVVMRVAMIAQWLRVASQDPTHRRVALTYVAFVATAQAGWVGLLLLRESPWWVFLPAALVTVFLDAGGVVIAERRAGGTPWHPHHIAERYGLLVIIALGEVIFGMIASVSAVIQAQGWSSEAILLIVAGLALTFGMWWVYFIMPSGAVLAVHRERSFGWGYSHLIIFAAIAATGAGLHVAAYVLEGEAHISAQAALLTVVIPEFVFLVALFSTYSVLVRDLDAFHFLLVGAAIAALVAAVLLVGAGVGFGISLLVACLAPTVVIVGFETLGQRHQAAVLARMR